MLQDIELSRKRRFGERRWQMENNHIGLLSGKEFCSEKEKKKLSSFQCVGLGQFIPADTCQERLVGRKSWLRRKIMQGPRSDPGEEWACIVPPKNV